MSENMLLDVETPCTPLQVYQSLQDIAAGLTRNSIRVLMAQSALETGWWHHVHCYNFGNMKHVPGDGHDYCQFPCNEVIGGRTVPFSPPSPACSFVAFQNMNDGMNYYYNRMKTRFSSSWIAVINQDPSDFCHRLKMQGYYTANEAQYTHSVIACFNMLDKWLPQEGDGGGTVDMAA
jgi:hypothetical protein